MSANATVNTTCAVNNNKQFGDVCVLGLGITGRAVVAYFLEHSERCTSLTIYAGSSTPETLAFAKTLPNNLAILFDQQIVQGSYTTTVVSPGISPQTELYQSAQACSLEVISEPELAWRLAPERWIGITGTNGKTTVTALTAHLLRSGGLVAHEVGNIGTPCIAMVDQREPGDWLVAELSSYQLHSTVHFCPQVAVVLNITPDHVSWHGSHEQYRSDKLKLLANLAEKNGLSQNQDFTNCKNGVAVIDATLPQTRAAFLEARAQGVRAIPLGTRDGLSGNMVARCGASEAGFVNADTGRLEFVVNDEHVTLLPVRALQLRGEHNYGNALAAASAALLVGVEPAHINEGLASFKPLEHRLEPCGEVDGVHFVNDSKATNTDAAVKAVLSFGSDLSFDSDGAQSDAATTARQVIALFGGTDKGTELDDLVHACAGVCKSIICYGAAGERFYQAFAPGSAQTIRAVNLKDAFTQAVALAVPDDIVLLAPACASFDEFSSFEARGAAFKQLVAALGGERR